jgi:hypothetical protein
MNDNRLFWKNHMKGWEESNLPQREYCRLNNLKVSTFTFWRTRFKREANKFIEIKPALNSPTVCITTVILPNGIQININTNSDIQTALPLITMLKEIV